MSGNDVEGNKSKGSISPELRLSRFVLRNPYAYLNDAGTFESSYTATPETVTHSEPFLSGTSDAPRLIPSQMRALQPDRVSAPSRTELQNQYAYLNELGHFELPPNRPLRPSRTLNHRRSTHTRTSLSGLTPHRVREIEATAQKLLRDLWVKTKTKNPFEVLDPANAAAHLGFTLRLEENLTPAGVEPAGFETAGILDRRNRTIQISRRLPPPARRFTAAHEIGHVLLHREVTMHRDRPLDGSRIVHGGLDPVEREADVFAAFLLMPQKLLTNEFKTRFALDSAGSSAMDDFAFGLSPSNPRVVLEAGDYPLALEKLVASAERFLSIHFVSLAEQFGVSITAMAIRLRDTGLVHNLIPADSR